MRPALSLKGRALALLAQREQSVVELRRKLMRHAQLAAKAEASTAAGSVGAKAARAATAVSAKAVHAKAVKAAKTVVNIYRAEVARGVGNVDGAFAVGDGPGVVDAGDLVNFGEMADVANADDVDDYVDVGAVAGNAKAATAARVDAVIEWLRANDFLSEDRFVESRVHARSARFGHARIRHELAQHGLALSPDLAAGLRASEFERAAEVWRRRFREPPTDLAAQAKQMRFLIARGFSSDVVRRLVRIERHAAPESADD